MNKTRLLKLAALLETIPTRKFDMGTWGDFGATPTGTEPRCATRACALGWATAIPEFNRKGLKLVARPGDYMMAKVVYKGVEGTEAGQKFFGLTAGQAEYLFHDGSYTAKRKAHEIRELVRTNGASLPYNFTED